MSFKLGDIVTRSSYDSDVIFKIEDINGDNAILRSCKLRLMADAPLSDLIKVNDEKKNTVRKSLQQEAYNYLMRMKRNLILYQNHVRSKDSGNFYRERPGRVLHLDGDKDYLELSMQNYKNLQIDAQGYYLPEKEFREKIYYYLKAHKPDILVITGHDGKHGGKDYRTSEYFVQAVKIARSYEKNLDSLVIFAGACQSSYNELIEAGSNFASSPGDELIHFLDPVLVVEKIAYTPIADVVRVKELVGGTISGEGGIGGVETRGQLRLCYP